MRTINFGETEGNIAFGFLSDLNTFPDVDPSIGSLSLSTQRHSDGNLTMFETVKEHEVTNIIREN